MNYLKNTIIKNYRAMIDKLESVTSDELKKYVSVDEFKFHQPLEEDCSNNGLYFTNIYIPEEIVMLILSYIDPKQILTSTLVCRKWCNIIKSDILWSIIYYRHYSRKAKKLPWFVYYSLFTTNNFNTNLLKNGNGEKQYKNWTIVSNYGDEFKIEDPPVGADPLPPMINEFNGHTSCFATSYFECNKLQTMSIKNKRLLQLILNKYKPHIYISEYMAGRFDCGCLYKLQCKLLSKEQSNSDNVRIVLFEQSKKVEIQQWEGSKWQKMEMIIKDYPEGVEEIIFQHEGKDTQFWKGHYGSKMAGGIVKILFDSIQ